MNIVKINIRIIFSKLERIWKLNRMIRMGWGLRLTVLIVNRILVLRIV